MAKKVNKNNVKEEIDIKNAIVVIISLFLIVGVMYALTVGAKKLGLFDLGYTKPEVKNATINYENILAGMTFNRAESEYYVVFDNFDSEESIYLSSLGTLYNQKKEDKLHVYVVNTANGMNSNVVSNEANPYVQDASELKIDEATLIKIKDGKNIKYIKGVDNIKTEFGV